MAELKIRKKKPVWPWIILLLVLIIAALIYLVSTDKISLGNDNSSVIHMQETNRIPNSIVGTAVLELV